MIRIFRFDMNYENEKGGVSLLPNGLQPCIKFTWKKGAVRLSQHGSNLHNEGLWGLPCEVGVDTAEVTVSSSLLHDGSSQVKVSDDSSGTEVEVLHYNSHDFDISLA